MERDKSKNRNFDTESSESELEDCYTTEMLRKDIKKCKKIEECYLVYLCKQVQRNLRKAESILNEMPITCKSDKRFLKIAQRHDEEIKNIEEILLENCHNIAKEISGYQGPRRIVNVSKMAKELSSKFLDKLLEAEEEMKSELKKRNLYITDKVEDISNHHEMPEFTGVLTEEAYHYYEYIEKMNYYCEMMDITAEDQGGVMFQSLSGDAKMFIEWELGYKALYDKDKLQELLENKYGNPQLLIRNIERKHERIGKIPVEASLEIPYKEMENMARKHLVWCRKAISLEKAKPGSIDILYYNMLSWVLPMYAAEFLYFTLKDLDESEHPQKYLEQLLYLKDQFSIRAEVLQEGCSSGSKMISYEIREGNSYSSTSEEDGTESEVDYDETDDEDSKDYEERYENEFEYDYDEESNRDQSENEHESESDDYEDNKYSDEESEEES